MNGSFESNEKKSAKGLLEKLSDVKISQSRKLTKTSTVSQTLLGNLVRKKCLEPQDQPQLLTIQNLYDADDSVTVHPINITSSNWNNRNYDINRRVLQRENSSLSIQPQNRYMTNKQSFNFNMNLKPNKVFSSSMPQKKNDTQKTTKNQAGKTIKYGANKNPSINKFSSVGSSSESNRIRNYEFDQKYMEYKRTWDDTLIKLKRRHENKWRTKKPNTAKLEDFELTQTLGNGSYGTVLLCRHIETNTHYAIKVLKKKSVVKSKQVSHTLNEKKILSSISFPFITSLIYSFKDNSNLYMVLPFVAGGEMFAHLHRVSRFSEALTKFYCAQVILAVEYLHSLDIIHRDLKPENTLISSDGYIKISDFGFAKYVPGRTYTLCGTPEYFAPEMIKGKAYGKAVDWWSVGVLTFELAVKEPPFQHSDQLKLYEKILNARLKLPPYLSEEIKDFMHSLIQPDLTKRFGNLKNGVNDIKLHKWLANIDWMRIYEKKAKVPNANAIPKLNGPSDTSRFDRCINFQVATSTVNEYENEFKDF